MWDALASGRADLLIGAGAEAPSGGGYATLTLGEWQWVFVAAPTHPITLEQRPLSEAVITKHRAVSVADSSRNMPPRTIGLISGQDVLTVPTMRDKVAAHIAGLGVGFLPKHIAAPEIKAKRLVAVDVEVMRRDSVVCVAWRANRTGRALRWFIQQLEQPDIARSLLLANTTA
jgi:DNA-binding transcriptional LysR family regulator